MFIGIMTILYALTALGALAILSYIMAIWRTGRAMKKEPGFRKKEEHKRLVREAVGIMIATVVLVELLVQLRATRYEITSVHWLHWGADVVVVATALLILYRYTGERNPLMHRWLVYPCLLASLIVATTGPYLLFSDLIS